LIWRASCAEQRSSVPGYTGLREVNVGIPSHSSFLREWLGMVLLNRPRAP
jgi:hypothetical protein